MGVNAGRIVDRDVIRAHGADAASFLQGQLSQDVAAMVVDDSRWSLLLQPTGKMLAWLRVTREGDDSFLLDVAPGHGTAVLERLQRFKLRVACDLDPLDGWRALVVRGPDPAVPDEPHPTAARRVATAGATVGVEGYDLLGEAEALELPAGVADDAEAVLADRIAHAVPEMGAEIDESVIPAELGPWLVEESVSWTKGCYTGQELVARVDSRGSNTPRRLRRLSTTSAAAPGDEVRDGEGDLVGTVTSATGSAVLALLKRSVEPPAAVTVGGHLADVVA